MQCLGSQLEALKAGAGSLTHRSACWCWCAYVLPLPVAWASSPRGGWDRKMDILWESVCQVYTDSFWCPSLENHMSPFLQYSVGWSHHSPYSDRKGGNIGPHNLWWKECQPCWQMNMWNEECIYWYDHPHTKENIIYRGWACDSSRAIPNIFPRMADRCREKEAPFFLGVSELKDVN